jgi:hypothetical protein
MILSTRKASTALVDVIWAIADRQGEPRRKPRRGGSHKSPGSCQSPARPSCIACIKTFGTVDLALAASDLDEINAQAGRIAVQGEHAACPRPYLPTLI